MRQPVWMTSVFLAQCSLNYGPNSGDDDDAAASIDDFLVFGSPYMG